MLAKRRGRSHGNADRSERGKAAVRGRAGRRKTNVRQGKGERGGTLPAFCSRCAAFIQTAERQGGRRHGSPNRGAPRPTLARGFGCGASTRAAGLSFGLRRIRLGQGAPIRDETRPFGLRRVGPACGARIRTAARHRLRRVCMPQRAESGRGASIPSIPTAGRTFCGRAAYSDSTAGRFARRPQAWMRGNGLFSSKALQAGARPHILIAGTTN